MKTDLSPKHICTVDETSILWFQQSNRYVVVSESLFSLIQLYLSVESKALFTSTLNDSLSIEADRCSTIYDEITIFLKDAITVPNETPKPRTSLNIPIDTITKSYNINGVGIEINFESKHLESLIHPQISHYQTKNNLEHPIVFDIFRTDDLLHFFKNKSHVASYTTKMAHFLQGKFALELTNTVHNTDIEKWIATFHASTVSNEKEAIMIIGDSGNGKSTLSALLMTKGFDVFADDFTPLYQDMNLYRYPSAISIKKGAFDMLASELENFNTLKTYSNGPKKVNLKYIPNDAKESKTKLPCQKIVLVKYDQSQASELKAISLENILETLIPDSWISPNDAHALQFLNWLKTVQCFELNYSDNDFAIAKFKTLFDS
ncbi:hypothetical protein [uncultured Psychroserpens sp.]|uniref:hypothetical protein n=1 Tax=uncultured Psychroserpens sp. TaxID=255436 RepID=UPI0026323D78|nr:hypothetical protein [uncultured Psychroserpens sp.]